MNNWYFDFRVTFTFLDYIIERCGQSEFPIDRSNNLRAPFDRDPEIRRLLTSAIIGAKVWDIGCMEWPAGVGFKWHKDRYSNKEHRQSAINIMLNPITENNYAEFCDVNPDLEAYDETIHKREIISYIPHSLMLLNPKEWHRVVNNSNVSRYIFTIGFPDTNDEFSLLKQRFSDGKLFDSRYMIET